MLTEVIVCVKILRKDINRRDGFTILKLLIERLYINLLLNKQNVEYCRQGYVDSTIAH
jgi:hypothetical protein